LCRENKRVLKTQICITRPQCVKSRHGPYNDPQQVLCCVDL